MFLKNSDPYGAIRIPLVRSEAERQYFPDLALGQSEASISKYWLLIGR